MSESIAPTEPATSTLATCALCDAMLPVHASYIVRIDVYADPSLPPISGDEITSFDFDQALAQITEEAAGMTADDLQDGVHRRFLANPLGMPRESRAGEN